MSTNTSIRAYLLEHWVRKYFTAFIAAVIAGLIIHFQLYSNMLMSPDSLWNSGTYHAGGWDFSLGRWFWIFIDMMGFGTVLPFWNTFLYLTLYGVTSVILAKLFNINDRIVQVILSVFIISSPYIAMGLQYYCYSIKFASGCLFSILSIYLIRNRSVSIIRYLLSIIMLSLSIACYQSNLGLASITALSLLFFNLLDKSIYSLKQFLHSIYKYLIVFLGGIILYYVIMQLTLFLLGIKLASYKGASDISLSSSIQSLPHSIFQCYKDFFEYFAGNGISRNAYGSKACYLIFALIVLLSVIKLFRTEKEYWKKLIYTVLMLIIPIACNMIDLIATKANMYLLTIGGMLAVVPLLTILMMKIFKNNTVIKRIICISILALSYTFILQDNVDSKVMLENYKQASSLANRIWQRIEEQPNYSSDMKIMIAGIPSMNTNYALASDYLDNANEYARWGLFWPTWDGSTNCWKMLIKNELGINVNMCSQKEYQDISFSASFSKIDEYPAQNSIGMINNILVVKVSDIK